ncbi:MAG: hypothetical protein FWC00_04715 [Firmicutes bacterium]|nr:hypothetical protein [Bacillota bacterium]
MKKKMKNGTLSYCAGLLWQKKILIVFLVFMVAFVPFAMTQQSVVLERAIVTGLAIDKQDGKYVVYTEVLMFNFDPFGVPERELLKATADNLQDALREIGDNEGRIVSLSHCTVITLGSGLEGENILDLLMPFMLEPHPSNACVLFYTTGDVEALMKASIETGDARSARIQQIAEFNRRQNRFVHADIEDFFKRSKSGDRTVRVAVLSEQEGTISNTGAEAIFVDGVLSHTVGEIGHALEILEHTRFEQMR